VTSRRPARALLGASLVIALGLGACGSLSPAAPTLVPTATAFAAAATTSVAPVATFGPPGPDASQDTTTPLTIDAGLLKFLPEQVAGVAVSESVDSAADALGEPDLGGLASGLDVAVGVAGDGNLVYALVVRLRPGGLNDVAFRQWRDTYDQGACSAAGGVSGHAQSEIAGRTVYIGSCVSGIRTYHVLLPKDGLLITAWSIGEGRYGEQLMATLRVPS
jgi:hypothetical protein